MTARRKTIIAALFLLVALAAAPGHAARFSGSYLLYVCGLDENGQEVVPGGRITCQSYIAGVIDYHNVIHSLGTSPSVDFCVPEEIDLDVLQQVVVEYLTANREDHAQFVAAPAVAMALYEHFPCKGGK